MNSPETLDSNIDLIPEDLSYLRTEPQQLAEISDADRAQFESIFEKYYHRISKFAALHTGSIDTGEEISQETFTNLLVNMDKLASGTEKDFRLWLFKSARNRIIDFHRRKDLVGFVELGDPACPDPEPYQQVADKETIQEAFQPYGSRNHKRVPAELILFASGYSTNEIMELTGKQEMAVSSLIFRQRRNASRNRQDFSAA